MKTQKLCRIALMAALMVAMKEVLAFLPNGELVTEVITVGTLVFGWETVVTSIVFSLIEILIYGFGLWTVMYLYIWPLLALIVMGLRRVVKSKLAWCVVMSLYGLVFGTLCSLPYFVIGGPKMALPWIASGLWFDAMHCAWNFVFGYVTFDALKTVFLRAKSFSF